MWPNWRRCSGRASAFAPASIRTEGPRKRRSGPRSPAGCTSGSRPISSRPAASIAPVFPAETTTPPRPSATARQAANSELSRLSRAASAGFSCIPTTWARRRSRGPARAAERRRRGRRGSARRRRTGLARARDDLVRRPDLHPSRRRRRERTSGPLRGGRLERLDLAAAVRAAGRADVVRPLGLMAVRALDDDRAESLCFARRLSRRDLDCLSLGDCHRGG